MTAAESGDLGERIQCLAMQSLASLAALGATSADVFRMKNIQFAFLHSSRDELEQEVRRLMVANPKVQALIEAFQNEVRRIASKDAIRGGILTLCQETFLQLQRIDGNCSEEEKALFERMKYNFKETIKTVATGLSDLTGRLKNRLTKLFPQEKLLNNIPVENHHNVFSVSWFVSLNRL